MENQTEKKTLLIVDDVELFIQLQVSHLGHKRYNIHTASSGTEGLRLARSLKPDLILLDLFMPDMNGDHVCSILKGDPDTSSIPIVLVSSGARGRSRAVSVSSNCDGLIFKPVRRDLLLSVVENLLGTNLRVRHRIQVSLPASAVLDEKEYPATIHSLSCDGAFLVMEPELIRGDLVELSFALPDQEEMIKIRAAAAVWCGLLKEDGPTGAGVYFLTIDQETRKRISAFVQKHLGFNTATYDGDSAGDSM